MRHRTILVLLVLLAVSFLFTACSDNPTTPEKTRRELLLAHKWNFQQALVVATGRNISSEIAVFTITFFDDGRGETEGEHGVETFTWQLTNNDNILVVEDDPCAIRVLTGDRLTLRTVIYGEEADLFFVK